MKSRRRSPFVYHKVQHGYLKLVICAMFGPALVLAGCLYYLIWQTVAYELAIPELIHETLFPAFHRVNQILLVGVPLVSSVILFFAIQLSHRVAGPLDRIERELDTMVRTGNYKNPMRIRPKDELQPLVDKINSVIRGARRKRP
jgi:hypothetical protein